MADESPLTPKAPLNLTTLPNFLCQVAYGSPGVSVYRIHSSPQRKDDGAGPGICRKAIRSQTMQTTNLAREIKKNPTAKMRPLDINFQSMVVGLNQTVCCREEINLRLTSGEVPSIPFICFH